MTKEQDPRTRCWRVVVPHRFKVLMENFQPYPDGWRYREFIGTFREQSSSAKKPRYGSNVVDQVMGEEDKEKAEVNRMKEELIRLRQAVQNTVPNGTVAG